MNIYYDGECPFCTRYVFMLKLREVVGQVNLISLRSQDTRALKILSSGINVNKGFVIEYEGRLYFGGDAFYLINSLVTRDDGFGKIKKIIFSSKKISSFIYKILTYLRYILLFIIGGTLIGKGGNFNSKELPIYQDITLLRLIRISALILIAIFAARFLYPIPLTLPFRVSIFFILTSLILFSFISFLYDEFVRKLVNGLENLNWRNLFVYIAIWFLLISSMDLIALRRIIAFIAILPIIRLAWKIGFKYQKDSNVGAVGAWVPFAICIFAFFPSLYVAPFYGGIAGWTLKIDRTQPVRVSGYQLANLEGETVWFNHAFFQPISMDGRLERAFQRVDASGDRYMKFIYETYARSYPKLKSGFMPHQFLLGNLAYPTHNLSKNNALDYSDNFSPELISKVIRVDEYYDWNDKFLRSVVVRVFDVPRTEDSAR
jgi:predicted DCC family thiol-disulfide oxidoreductase YuxK